MANYKLTEQNLSAWLEKWNSGIETDAILIFSGLDGSDIQSKCFTQYGMIVEIESYHGKFQKLKFVEILV